MKCRETNKLFTAYLDNEVTPEERKSVQSHLDSCPVCREELSALSLMRSKIKQTLGVAAENVAPSPRVWTELRQQFDTERRIPRKGGFKPMSSSLSGLRGLFSRQLVSKPLVFGAIAIILVVSLSLAIPSLFGKGDQVLASDIALSNPDVKAALNGQAPANIGMTDNIDSAGTTRVVLTMPPDRVIVAEVDMKKQAVTSVNVQLAADITMQQVIDIAQADPRVEKLLKAGYNIYYNNVEQYNVSLYSKEEITASLMEVGITNPQDFYGFMGAIMLKVNPGYDAYLVFVNESIGKVIGILANPFPDGTPPITVTAINTWELYH